MPNTLRQPKSPNCIKLTFVLANTSPIWNEQLPATTRTVELYLEPWQLNDIQLAWTHSSGYNEYHEKIAQILWEEVS